MSVTSSILSPVPRNFTFLPQLGQIPPYPGNGRWLDYAVGSSGDRKCGLASGGHEVKSFIPLLLSFFVLHSLFFVLCSVPLLLHSLISISRFLLIQFSFSPYPLSILVYRFPTFLLSFLTCGSLSHISLVIYHSLVSFIVYCLLFIVIVFYSLFGLIFAIDWFS